MADSINIPVNVDVNVDKQQLNNVSSQIEKSVNKIKGFKTKDFFAPITNSAKTLTKSLRGIQGGVTNLTNSFSGLKRVAMSALSLTALIKVGKEMVKLSSDLIEVQNVVDTVFGDMSSSINDFSKSALKSFGLTELQAKNFSSTIGAIVKASGLGKEATLEMSEGITKLTGDVASFYNLDHEVAFEKLRSGITGETEPLKSLGVVMTVANLEAYRLSQGITTSYKSMSEAQKVALRYNFILDTLSDAQGDFTKTQGSWSNQVRILGGQIKQLGAILGGFLQKILYPVLTVINQIIGMAISGATALAKMFGFDVESIQMQQGVSGAGAGVGVDVGDTGASAMDDLADSTDDATKAQKKLNKEQNKSLANIHELNVLSSNKSSDSSGSSGGKVGGAGIGDIGFDLAKYKDISEKDNPISNLFKNLEKAVKENNWRGVGSLLAAELNELMSKIDLAQYIPAVEKASRALADILNGFVQNLNFKEVGRILGEGINLITAGVNAFFDQFDFVSLGQQIARGLNSLFDTVDFEALGQFLVNKFNAIFQTLAGFVTEFDWESLGIKLAEGINSIFNNFDFNSFSIAIYGGINGVFETIGTTILNLDWVGVGEKFAKSFSTIFSNIDYGMILVTIIKGIEGILLSISTFLAEINWDSIFEKVKTGINTAINVLGDVDFATIASNLSTGIINLVSSLSDLIKGIDWMQLSVNLYNGIKDIVMNVDWLGLIGSIGELIFNEVGATCTIILTLVVALIADLGSLILGLITSIGEWLGSIWETISTWFTDLITSIGEWLGGIWESISTWFTTLVTNVSVWLVSIRESISTWFTDLVTSIGEWLGNIWESISTWFTTLVTNIGTWIGSVWTKLSEWFTTLVTDVVTWLGNVWTSISTWFTTLLTDIDTWVGNIWTNLSTWFTGLVTDIGTWLGNIWSPISNFFGNIWNDFTGTLKKIIDYITGTFSESWSNAWEGIKSVFTGIFDTIGGVFKSVINTVIDGINTVINAINTISWTVPEWVPSIGGSTFGFSIPNVPKLAKGAVIPPNQEFLAILGDQKRGVNIETPLDTMLQAFRGALAEFEDYNGGDIIIPIYVNNELSSEEIIRKQDIARYRSNGK